MHQPQVSLASFKTRTLERMGGTYLLFLINMSSPVSFPAPVGGVPFESDFIPSIVFACFYAVLVFVGVFRMAVSSTRSVVLIGLFIFVFER